MGAKAQPPERSEFGGTTASATEERPGARQRDESFRVDPLGALSARSGCGPLGADEARAGSKAGLAVDVTQARRLRGPRGTRSLVLAIVIVRGTAYGVLLSRRRDVPPVPS